MDTEVALTETQGLILHLSPILKKMNNHEFFKFCRLNPDLRIELTSEGDLIIMPPTGGQTGKINFTLTGFFSAWVERDGSGIGFDSSTGFILPNGAKRSPDLAWVERSRWETLTEEEQKEFPPLCPDFIVEIRSPSDSIKTLKAKMKEYLANGARLGWLIDPLEKQVYIYLPSAKVRPLKNPKTISGEPVLPGFILDLGRLWS